MSGHSKWSTIKRKKGALDAKRSKIFTKIIKEIAVAVKEGGGSDPEFNPRLRLAVGNAKGANMPKENIERAIKRASEAGGASYAEVTYEGHGAGGIAVFVECSTDNLNRTVSNVRSYFNKYGAGLGTNGSVDYLFDRKGVFVIPQGSWTEDDLTLELIDAGAEEVELEDGQFTITTAVTDYGNMQKKLDEMDIEPTSVELQRIPKAATTVDLDTAKKVMKLIDALEEDDDVQAVYHSMELTDEIMTELEKE